MAGSAAAPTTVVSSSVSLSGAAAASKAPVTPAGVSPGATTSTGGAAGAPGAALSTATTSASPSAATATLSSALPSVLAEGAEAAPPAIPGMVAADAGGWTARGLLRRAYKPRARPPAIIKTLRTTSIFEGMGAVGISA